MRPVQQEFQRQIHVNSTQTNSRERKAILLRSLQQSLFVQVRAKTTPGRAFRYGNLIVSLGARHIEHISICDTLLQFFYNERIFESRQTHRFLPDEKPFSCEYCQTQFRRKDNLNRHIRHHHSEDSSCGEASNKVPPAVVKADRSCSVKSNNQQSRCQRQRSRKIQPKSPGKVVAANSHQINSRLDPMGNITPVIRTTAEVSNAVSVINGPISARRSEERTCKKVFTYMEPIPIAEAAVLNCRIEEKLYPQSASSHNYFVHNYLKDRNSKVNSYPNNDNDNELEPSLPRRISRSATNIVREEKCHPDEDNTRKADEGTRRGYGNPESKERPGAASPGDKQQSNCVSTIKKHTIQQSDGETCGNSGTTNHCATLPNDVPNAVKKKQSDVHWRRRTAETLKPCNR